MPGEESETNNELARRIHLIYKTHERGLNGFFERVERDENEREKEISRIREKHLKRLIESACASPARADA